MVRMNLDVDQTIGAVVGKCIYEGVFEGGSPLRTSGGLAKMGKWPRHCSIAEAEPCGDIVNRLPSGLPAISEEIGYEFPTILAVSPR